MPKKQKQTQEDVPYYLRKEAWVLSYPEQFLMAGFRAMDDKKQEEMLVLAKNYMEGELRARQFQQETSQRELEAFRGFIGTLIKGNTAA